MHLTIDKRNFSDIQWQPCSDASGELAKGTIRLKLSHFSITANNITYALLGESFRYWELFPNQLDERGLLPVWGLVTVTESNVDEIQEGEQWFGLCPLANEFVIEASLVDKETIYDASEARRSFDPAYQRYRKIVEPLSEQLCLHLLFRPLFVTAYLLDNYLAERAFYDAERMVFSSASSKTAIATAKLLKDRCQAEAIPCELVGFTSPANQSWLESLGCYDRGAYL